MAWRPTAELIEGELDNVVPGKVTGWLTFAGVEGRVTLDLEGDFHRDIRGARIRLRGYGDVTRGAGYLKNFALVQKGQAGDITAGRQPCDYVDYPYIEWYSDDNGRVVLELRAEQVEVIGDPIPATESTPIQREQSNRLLMEWLRDLSVAVGAPAFVVGVPTDEKKS